jgi:hypothetical protein
MMYKMLLRVTTKLLISFNRCNQGRIIILGKTLNHMIDWVYNYCGIGTGIY